MSNNDKPYIGNFEITNWEILAIQDRWWIVCRVQDKFRILKEEKQDTELEFLQNNIIDPDLTTPLIAFASVLVLQILAGKFYCYMLQ